MQRKTGWKRFAVAVLMGAVIMTGCAPAKADSALAVKTVDDSVPGTVERSTGQEDVSTPEPEAPVTEPTTGGEPDRPTAAAMTGRYLRTKTGGNMVVLDQVGPVNFQGTEQQPKFAGLGNGDLIEVTLEFIQESYPGQSEALDVRLLEEGGLEDVDADTLTRMTEMGWLVPEKEEDWQVMLNGVLLRSTGRRANVTCGTQDGTLTSSVAVNQTPVEEGQSNFGFRENGYIYLNDNAAAVMVNGDYILFLADGIVEYEGDFFEADKLSEETLDWLENYNSLPEEQQRSISMVPPDLIVDRGQSDIKVEETAAVETKQTPENQSER